MMKTSLAVALLSAIFLSACATHTPAPEPKGDYFPINKPYPSYAPPAPPDSYHTTYPNDRPMPPIIQTTEHYVITNNGIIKGQ